MTQLSIVSDELDLDFRTASELARSAEIRRFELRLLTSGRVPFCAVAEIAEIENCCREEGLTISAISPGLFKHARSDADFLQELQTTLPRSLDLAGRVGARKLLTFSGERGDGDPAGELAQAAEWLGRAAECAAAAGMRLLIEPEPVCRADTGLAAARLLEAAAHGALGINYDPCNVATATHADPLLELGAIADLIEGLHLKDLCAVSAAGEADYVPFGDGILNYPGIFGKLRASGYAGELSLEPHLNAHGGKIDREMLCLIAWRTRSLWAESASNSTQPSTSTQEGAAHGG